MGLTTKQVLDLLAGHPPEVRRAAVVVLGELGGKDAEVARALVERLDDEDGGLRLEVLRAVGKLKVESALPALLERIKHGGEEANLAAQAAARLGAKGARALRELMPKVAPGLRRYIASALAGGGTASAGAAVEVLLDKDPGVVEATVRSFMAQGPSLTAAQTRNLADELLELLENRPPAVSEAAAVRLLVALEDERVAAVLWERVLPPHTADVRAASLQALGTWLKSPSKEQFRRLFVAAADRDFRVVAPALLLLKPFPLDAR